MKRTFAAGAAALVACAGMSRTAAAQEPFAGLDAYVTKAIQTWKIPAVSIAIVRNDSVLYTKGYGTLSNVSRQPVNDQTLFEIGSSSKAFTATLVAMLVTDGKMKFDDHMTDYLPWLKLYDPLASNELTIRDALTHRSGLARGELVWLGAGISRDEVLHRLRFLKPETPFRSNYSYQNMMFLAAGQAAGRAGGSTWDELVKQRIFTPLAMTSTVTTSKGLMTTNVASPQGMQRDSAFIKPFMSSEDIAPAGAIISNARDMAQWIRFQLADGTINGKRLVGSAQLRETHSPQILVRGGSGGRGDPADSIPITNFSTYGMGWFIEDYHHQLMWQHGGNTDGMTAAVGMLPEQKFGVVVLSDMASAQLPALIMHYIFDRQLKLPTRDLSGEAYTRMMAQRKRADSLQVVQAAQPRGATEPPVPLSAFVGTYADSLYGDVTVSLVDGHLDLVRGEWRGPLAFKTATNFEWTMVPISPTGPINIKFDIGPDGKVNGLYFGIGGDITLLGRKAAAGRGGRGGRGAPPGGGR